MEYLVGGECVGTDSCTTSLLDNMVYRGRSRILCRRGRLPSRGTPTYYFVKNFPKNCMKSRTFWTVGGRVPEAPPKSATGINTPIFLPDSLLKIGSQKPGSHSSIHSFQNQQKCENFYFRDCALRPDHRNQS